MTAASVYRSPLSILQELGVTEPEDLHLEAIAQYCGATIVYEPLKGCEARLIGYGDRAIITVNTESYLPRQRFSAGHELGHWMRDRGKIAFVCAASTFALEWSDDNPERRANRYAADLLLPEFMFRPFAQTKDITFATVKQLAGRFQTSTTATAIRLVEQGSFPAMIICNQLGRRRWFLRGPAVSDKLWPYSEPGRDTVAYDLLRTPAEPPGPVEVRADGWIDHSDSYRYHLCEDSVRVPPNLVLTLIWWKDESQILDLDENDET